MIGSIKNLRGLPQRDSLHVVLTPFWAHAGPATAQPGTGRRVIRTVAWEIWLGKDGPAIGQPMTYDCPARLAAYLLTLAPRRKGLTVWLPRGWEDFVGSGLANVVDQGEYRYRWACLDGSRVLFAGRLAKRPVNVTSLSAWTGGSWDAWADEAAEALANPSGGPDLLAGMDEADPNTADLVTALGTVVIVLGACNVLSLGKPKLSIGAQARVWWAGWGGLTVRVARPAPGRKGAVKVRSKTLLTVPMPGRPAQARGHEGHCCHGLAREQYYRGHVGGPVHVLDMASAYLVGIAATPLPSVYHRTLRAPSAGDLCDALRGHTGCALVRLRETPLPYPVYRHDEPARAVGSYWAWLAGAELAGALAAGTVAECRLAHLWWTVTYRPRAQALLLGVGRTIEEEGIGTVKPFWRALYSACVGGWAQRRWAWEDVDQPSQVGRWATWTTAGPEPGQLERWRVIAGRVQRRVYKGEAPHALPLAYACVTAAVRFQLDFARHLFQPGDVLATACDALWLTDSGRASLDRLTSAGYLTPALWRVKDRFDDAWLDGRGGAVVLKGGYRYPLLPGVPSGVALADDGQAHWERASPWTDGVGPAPGGPIPRRRASWDGSALIARNGGPLQPVSPWITLCDTALPESMLAPYDPSRVRRRRKGGDHD